VVLWFYEVYSDSTGQLRRWRISSYEVKREQDRNYTVQQNSHFCTCVLCELPYLTDVDVHTLNVQGTLQVTIPYSHKILSLSFAKYSQHRNTFQAYVECMNEFYSSHAPHFLCSKTLNAQMIIIKAGNILDRYGYILM